MEYLSPSLSRVLKEVQRRTRKSSPLYYTSLPAEDSQSVRSYYEAQLRISPKGNIHRPFYTSYMHLIAKGYARVVIGDYGAYIEFTPEQIDLKAIKPKWPGEPTRPVKYLWYEPIDGSGVKIYWQKGTVSYADYKPGMYYIAPSELVNSKGSSFYQLGNH